MQSAAVRLTALLLLACVQAPAWAEGWENLFPLLGLGMLMGIYTVAAKALWWLLGGAVLAWVFHFVKGEAFERTQGAFPKADGAAGLPTAGMSAGWALFIIRWSLTLSALACMPVAFFGHIYLERMRELRLGAQPAMSPAESHAAAVERSKAAPWDRQVPNGGNWPRSSGYMEDMPQEASEPGGGEIVLSNAAGDTHFYVRLCVVNKTRLDPSNHCVPKRHAYVRRGDSVHLSDLAPRGQYAVQALDVVSGDAFLSDLIDLRQLGPQSLTLALPAGGLAHNFSRTRPSLFNQR